MTQAYSDKVKKKSECSQQESNRLLVYGTSKTNSLLQSGSNYILCPCHLENMFLLLPNQSETISPENEGFSILQFSSIILRTVSKNFDVPSGKIKYVNCR